MSGIWNLFRKSAFGPLQEHMKCVIATSDLVSDIIEALIVSEQGKVAALAVDISKREGLADEVKNSIRDHLPKTFFMSVDRGDLIRQLGTQDAIADCAEDLGVLLTLRVMEVPSWMAPLLRQFVQKVLEAVDWAGKIVGELDVLAESAFGGPEAERVMEMIAALSLTEHHADKLQDQAAKALFSHEDEMKPVAVFMWSKIFNTIGNIANNAENVGDRIRMLVAHR